MKITFFTGLSYWPAFDGASKVIAGLAEGLAHRGHRVRVVAYGGAGGTPHGLSHARFRARLKREGIAFQASPGVTVYRRRGVEVHSVRQLGHLLDYAAAMGRQLRPDVIVVSSEDPSLSLNAEALSICPGRVVSIVQTTYAMPFGPDNAFPGLAESDAPLRQSAIVTCGKNVSRYLKRWGRLTSTPMYFQAYGEGPFPNLARFDQGFVTLVNPCAQKGLPIFEAVAKACPDIAFAAVPTWGATRSELKSLLRLPNVRIVNPHEDIEHILKKTRVLLVPSLMHEAFPLIPVDAMLRGIPTVVSNAGGLGEARDGRIVVPVKTIDRYTGQYDAKKRPIPVVPRQNITPWVRAVRRILRDQATYEATSTRVRSQAHAFVLSLNVAPFEKLLRSLKSRAKTQ